MRRLNLSLFLMFSITSTIFALVQTDQLGVTSRYTTYCYISKGQAIGMFCAQGIEGVVGAEGIIKRYDRDGLP